MIGSEVLRFEKRLTSPESESPSSPLLSSLCFTVWRRATVPSFETYMSHLNTGTQRIIITSTRQGRNTAWRSTRRRPKWWEFPSSSSKTDRWWRTHWGATVILLLLGIHHHWRCRCERKKSDTKSWNAWRKQTTLLAESPALGLENTKQLIKSLIWSVALYAEESWTHRKEDTRRIEAFEMWCS